MDRFEEFCTNYLKSLQQWEQTPHMVGAREGVKVAMRAYEWLVVGLGMNGAEKKVEELTSENVHIPSGAVEVQ